MGSEVTKVRAQFDVMRGLIATDRDIEPDVRAMLTAGLSICESLVIAVVHISEAPSPATGM